MAYSVTFQSYNNTKQAMVMTGPWNSVSLATDSHLGQLQQSQYHKLWTSLSASQNREAGREGLKLFR